MWHSVNVYVCCLVFDREKTEVVLFYGKSLAARLVKGLVYGLVQGLV